MGIDNALVYLSNDRHKIILPGQLGRLVATVVVNDDYLVGFSRLLSNGIKASTNIRSLIIGWNNNAQCGLLTHKLSIAGSRRGESAGLIH